MDCEGSLPLGMWIISRFMEDDCSVVFIATYVERVGGGGAEDDRWKMPSGLIDVSPCLTFCHARTSGCDISLLNAYAKK